jgi:hypothetical protein
MGNFTMKPALTQTDVAHGLSERPCKNGFREACEKLPDWKDTAYSPSEMAEHGVHHDDIMWVFLRPEVLGRDAFIEATCRIAERALPVFETTYPDDNRPRAAINAAREYRDGKISKEEARQEARAADAAWEEAALSMVSARSAAVAAAASAWTARSAVRSVAAAASAWTAAASAWSVARSTTSIAAEQHTQIDIIEAVIEGRNDG